VTESEASRTETSSGGEANLHNPHHENNTPLFLKVFGALCVLTAISFAIANSPLMKSQGLAWAVMMVVSCAKAFLVISFFMHLKWERTWKYVLTIPASIMSLFLVIALVPDIGLRSENYSQARWLHATEPRGDQEASSHSPSTQTAEHDSESNAEQGTTQDEKPGGESTND